MKNKCEITIFLEHHDDKGATEAMLSLLGSFKSRGYTNFLFEEPSDQSYMETSVALKRAKNYYLSYLLNHLRSKVENKGYTELSDKEMHKLLANSQNIADLKEIGYQYAELKISYDTTLKLLSNIHNDPNFRIHNIDMPKALRAEHEERYASEDQVQTKENIGKRNEYMANQAQEICHAGGNKQVLLVGLSHYGIGDILESNGFTVNKIAAFTSKPLSIKDLPQGLSQSQIDDALYSSRVRDISSPEYQAINDLTLIDLYQNPDLNYTSVILGELDKTIQSNTDSEL